MPKLRILIADDNEHDALLMSRALQREGIDHDHRRVDTPEDLERALAEGPWDIILTDHAMPRMDSFHVLHRAAVLVPRAPVLVVSGFIGEEAAAHVVREGARDFVSKERLAFLAPAVQRALLDARQKAELEQARAMLQRNERLAVLGTFARGAAHEINNPLTYIQMEAEMALEQARAVLADPGLEAQTVRRWAEGLIASQAVILRGAQKIGRIVHGISTFSNTARGPARPLDVDEEVAKALPPAPNGVQLVEELHASCVARWPREALQHIVVTLLQNAYDAVEGRPAASVTVLARSDGAAATLEVADNGIGIPPQEQALLFTPFHTTKPDGVGLNLAIAHRLVADLGGRIQVESTPGTGTRWRVTLPLDHAAATGPGVVALRLP